MTDDRDVVTERIKKTFYDEMTGTSVEIHYLVSELDYHNRLEKLVIRRGRADKGLELDFQDMAKIVNVIESAKRIGNE